MNSATHRWPLVSCLCAAIALGTPLRGADLSGRPVDFGREVRPLLSDRCFACHGPNEEKRKVKLRFDTKDGLFQTRKDGALIVPGKPEESLLLERLVTDDADDRMPPADSGKTLKSEEIALIRSWIAQGAVWRQHWAYAAAARPDLPDVKSAGWVRNDVDRFILARLEKEALSPESEADRYALARRVTFDLTGLPPTPAEVDAFVSDGADGAYERLVDRLLQSQHYGEHMARFWLDAARYGDTHGLHLDNLRIMWPYRDWVIGAFNANLPFDQFAVEQIAGDLLPNASLSQVVASGFNRCHITTAEGGSIEEEVYVRNVSDRVSTFGTVFLGTAAGCTTCHDSKFDPMTTRDFYQLFAFFNSLDESPMDGNAAVYPPVAKVPTEEQKSRLAALRTELAAVDTDIQKRAAEHQYAEPAGGPEKPEPVEVAWVDDEIPAGATANGWKWSEDVKSSGKRSSTRTASGLDQHYFENAREPLTIAAGDALFAYVYLDPKNPPKEIMLQWNDGAWEHRAYWGENKIDWGQNGSGSRLALGPLPESGKWARLEVDAEKVGLKPGAKVHGWAFTQFDGTVYWDRAGSMTRDLAKLPFESYRGWIDAWRAGGVGSLPQEILSLIQKEPAERGESGEKKLKEYFIAHVHKSSRDVFEPLHKTSAGLKQKADETERDFPTTLISMERAQPREAFILKRGEYDKHGDKVERVTPAFLPPMKDDLPRNRLGLARWLVDPQHPLTARVIVNRLWQQVFGTGLVKTSEDFGSQGEPPSHPELIDWLATEFVRTGWDVKGFMRMLVTSAAYRQSSRVQAEKLSRDPENRLLARGPRYRLDAEMVRDQTLAASGLLVRAIGGPSVKPRQPAGLWEAVGYTSSNTAQFAPDSGEKIRRRSLYTFWKRTSPPPQMTTFDAPSREGCTVRRERTNTPLQALQLMNEEQQVECSRALAQRALREGGASPEERAVFLFRLLALRPPHKDDVDDLVALYRAQLSEATAQPEAAQLLLKVGETPADPSLDPSELAAWTLVGNLVLNLDEAINKG